MSSLLRHLATGRSSTDPVDVRYNATDQVSEVFENGRWVVSWQSRSVQQTKKCDHEKGEDQKGW
jgi:hypothetical protein